MLLLDVSLDKSELITVHSADRYLSVVVFASIAGVAEAYPAFKARIGELSTPAGAAELDRVRQRCAPANILAYGNQEILSARYFTSGPATLSDPVIQVCVCAPLCEQGFT